MNFVDYFNFQKLKKEKKVVPQNIYNKVFMF